MTALAARAIVPEGAGSRTQGLSAPAAGLGRPKAQCGVGTACDEKSLKKIRSDLAGLAQARAGSPPSSPTPRAGAAPGGQAQRLASEPDRARLRGTATSAESAPSPGGCCGWKQRRGSSRATTAAQLRGCRAVRTPRAQRPSAQDGSGTRSSSRVRGALSAGVH